MKKIVSIVLCMVMVLSLGVMAFADEQSQVETLLVSPLLISPEPLDILIAPAPGSQTVISEPTTSKGGLFVPAEMTEAEIKEALAGFTDYKEGEWYVEGLAFCVANKLMNGTSEKTISPAKKITRGEVVTMLYRLAGKPAFMNENVFTDVKAGSYCEEAVIWAQGKGIVNGTASDKFSPDQNITREDLITMIFNYVEYDLQEKGENTGILYPNLAFTYADTNKISSWATSAFRWATAEKIIQGKPGNLADPQGFATRAEAAAIFQRLGLVPDELTNE